MFVKDINTEEFLDLIESDSENLEIIDVREQTEYDEIHIDGSKLIPMMAVPSKLDDIDWDKKIVFVCRSGMRSFSSASALPDRVDSVMNLAGGIMGCLNNERAQKYLVKG